ncbi:hypothetical protein [Nostoc sp.]
MPVERIINKDQVIEYIKQFPAFDLECAIALVFSAFLLVQVS